MRLDTYFFIKCIKRSVIERSFLERSVFECWASKLFFELFFDFFFDYPLGAVEAFLDAKRLRSGHFRAFLDVKRLRSKHFRAFFDVRRLRSELFLAFSTSGGSGASFFGHFRRLEAPERGFSRFLEASSSGPACKVPTAPKRQSVTAKFSYR